MSFRKLRGLSLPFETSGVAFRTSPGWQVYLPPKAQLGSSFFSETYSRSSGFYEPPKFLPNSSWESAISRPLDPASVFSDRGFRTSDAVHPTATKAVCGKFYAREKAEAPKDHAPVWLTPVVLPILQVLGLSIGDPTLSFDRLGTIVLRWLPRQHSEGGPLLRHAQDAHHVAGLEP